MLHVVDDLLFGHVELLGFFDSLVMQRLWH